MVLIIIILLQLCLKRRTVLASIELEHVVYAYTYTVNWCDGSTAVDYFDSCYCVALVFANVASTELLFLR